MAETHDVSISKVQPKLNSKIENLIKKVEDKKKRESFEHM